MKQLLLLAIVCGLAPLWLTGCGYENPYLANKRKMAELETAAGAPVNLHAEMWANRTDELGLQLVFYNSIANWFQRSGGVQLTSSPEEADYSLAGEIIAIDEGLTRGTVRLTVRYHLRDLKRGETVWRVPAQTFSENYFIDETAVQTENNKRRALEKIADDLAESIYMRTLHHLRSN